MWAKLIKLYLKRIVNKLILLIHIIWNKNLVSEALNDIAKLTVKGKVIKFKNGSMEERTRELCWKGK